MRCASKTLLFLSHQDASNLKKIMFVGWTFRSENTCKSVSSHDIKIEIIQYSLKSLRPQEGVRCRIFKELRLSTCSRGTSLRVSRVPAAAQNPGCSLQLPNLADTPCSYDNIKISTSQDEGAQGEKLGLAPYRAHRRAAVLRSAIRRI